MNIFSILQVEAQRALVTKVAGYAVAILLVALGGLNHLAARERPSAPVMHPQAAAEGGLRRLGNLPSAKLAQGKV